MNMDGVNVVGKDTPTTDVTSNSTVETAAKVIELNSTSIEKETKTTTTTTATATANLNSNTVIKDDAGSSLLSSPLSSTSASSLSSKSINLSASFSNAAALTSLEATENACTNNAQAELSLSKVQPTIPIPAATVATVATVQDKTAAQNERQQQQQVNPQSTELNENSAEESYTQNRTLTTPTTTTAGGGAPLARSSPISREYVALQKSLIDSKILTEFVADATAIKAARKARKSGLSSSMRDSPSSRNKSTATNEDSPQTTHQQRSAGKRNMRSQNSEFAQKHMEFLKNIMNQQQSGDEQYGSESDDVVERNALFTMDEDDDRNSTNVSNSGNISNSGNVIAFDLAEIGSLDMRLKDIWQPAPKRGWDSFCWRCRDCGTSSLVPCSKCVRCFHKHCVKVSSFTKLDSSWICPECLAIENTLNSPKKSRRPDISLDMLSELLTLALKRMRTLKGSGKFLFNEDDYSHLSKYIVNPITFSTLEEKIAKKVFRCPEEFYNETKWMVHNAHIITTGFTNHKLLATAKALLKICRQETNEIETCAGCYLNANTRSDWFVDVCAQPHILLWAKLKGFPFWPAKAMGIGPNAVINVRFFGKHDRAFVPVKDCYLYSEKDPNMQTGKRSQRELADCIKEVEEHIKNIELKIGKFNYAPFRTPYDPSDEQQQLEAMMPGVSQYIKRQAQAQVLKPSLQYKIVKTAGNHLSIIKKGVDKEENEDSETAATENVADVAATQRKEHKSSAAANGNAASTLIAGSDAAKIHISTKYEVITKTTANDNDASPKVTAVILKKRRKTNNLEKEECVADAKMPKVMQSDPLAMLGGNGGGNKRKQPTIERSPGDASSDGSGSGEKQKAKHARTEPRLPILTIKTGCGAKLVEHASARDVVEHLSKTNAGVTIKKINKTAQVNNAATVAAAAVAPAVAENAAVSNAAATDEPAARATRSSAKELVLKPATTTTSATTPQGTASSSLTSAAVEAEQKIVAEKTDNNDERRNIFRELVPFVEIKQEISSDVEDEAAATITAATATTTAPNGQEFLNETAVAPANVQATLQEPAIEPLMPVIKSEIMSDDEEVEAANVAATQNVAETHKETASRTKNTQDGGSIRLVGDTIIQRLSSKHATTQQQQQQQLTTLSNATNSSAGKATSPPYSEYKNSKQRASTRSSGVPYGPFPAAAATSSSPLSLTGGSKIAANSTNEISFSELSQQQQQRARKSFPTRSPPRIMTTVPITANQSQRATAAAAAAAAATSVSPPALTMNNANKSSSSNNNNNSNNNSNNKQQQHSNNILKSTSMVSIPADIAAQRHITQNSVPMPPLTAVSKTTPITATATNSIANTAASNSTITRIGNITTAAFANTTNNNNNNNTANTFAPSPPSKLSAPPPLAGLTTFATVSQLQQQQQQQVLPAANVATPPTAATMPVAAVNNNNNNCAAAINTIDLANVNANPVAAAPPPPLATTENHLLGDFVTPALANAITEVICRGPPRMAPRPNGPLQSDGSTMFPSEAGPVCRTLVQNAHKLTDFFISVMEDTMSEMSNHDEPSLHAKITLLTMELERMKQAHEQEIAELKRTSDLMLCEMRKSMENEKTRIANEIRKQCELERLRCVDEAKRKQWCVNCGREAQFYCCWNTSYCDYPCQQQHWARHAANCTQSRANNETSASPGTTTQPGSATVGLQQQPAMTAAAANNNMNSLSMNTDNRAKNNATTTVNVHYNQKVANTKKDKSNAASNAAHNALSKSAMNVAAEMLKLPSNTSLRAVAVGGVVGGNQQTRSAVNMNATPVSQQQQLQQQQQQQQQQQRFNIALPLSSAPTLNSRTPYTIVQRGNSWELMTSTTNSLAPMTAVSIASAPQQTTLTNMQPQRSAPNLTIGRTRTVMSYNTPATNGNMRSTQM